jgi:hypothetical protein
MSSNGGWGSSSPLPLAMPTPAVMGAWLYSQICIWPCGCPTLKKTCIQKYIYMYKYIYIMGEYEKDRARELLEKITLFVLVDCYVVPFQFKKES